MTYPSEPTLRDTIDRLSSLEAEVSTDRATAGRILTMLLETAETIGARITRLEDRVSQIHNDLNTVAQNAVDGIDRAGRRIDSTDQDVHRLSREIATVASDLHDTRRYIRP